MPQQFGPVGKGTRKDLLDRLAPGILLQAGTLRKLRPGSRESGEPFTLRLAVAERRKTGRVDDAIEDG
ncbi:hypothetical protein CKO23_16630 [Thiocystis violacea]|nr:hypothetical protein [Thiocystis violacea]